MMWRERIQAARERGRFTEEDVSLASFFDTCAAGECSVRMGVPLFLVSQVGCPLAVYAFMNHVRVNDFDGAERVLDLIEDHALKLKRESA